MKKLVAVLLLAVASTSAMAQHHGHGGHRHNGHYRGNNWVAPAIIGGVLVYGAVNSQPRPPVVVQQPPQYYPIEPNQPQHPPVGYHWEQILDSNCQCYRVVLVGN